MKYGGVPEGYRIVGEYGAGVAGMLKARRKREPGERAIAVDRFDADDENADQEAPLLSTWVVIRPRDIHRVDSGGW